MGSELVASTPKVSDSFACSMIKAMVAEVDDNETADSAFAAAWDQLAASRPKVGSNTVMLDLAARGWISIRQAVKARERRTDPRVRMITAKGRTAAAGCDVEDVDETHNES